MLGWVEMIDAKGEPTAMFVLQGFVRNQGDGWSFALDYLDRVLGQLEMVPISIEVDVEDLHAMFRGLSQTLGTRIGELHQAFALPVEDPAFQPEPVTETDCLPGRRRLACRRPRRTRRFSGFSRRVRLLRTHALTSKLC